MLTQCSSPSLFPRTGTVLNFLYPLSHIFSTISTISLCFTHQIHVNVIKPRPFESMIHLFFFFSQYSLTSYCCVSQFNCAKPLTFEKKKKKALKISIFLWLPSSSWDEELYHGHSSHSSYIFLMHFVTLTVYFLSLCVCLLKLSLVLWWSFQTLYALFSDIPKGLLGQATFLQLSYHSCWDNLYVVLYQKFLKALPVLQNCSILGLIYFHLMRSIFLKSLISLLLFLRLLHNISVSSKLSSVSVFSVSFYLLC